MIVSAEEAVNIFYSLPAEMRSYYFHPQYVINDAYSKELQPVFFVHKNAESIFYHAFHLGKVPDTSYFDIQSPYGYGGPLILGDVGFIEECIQKYKKWCLDNSVMIEFIRFHPLLKNEINYYGQVFENRQTVYIDLTYDDLFTQFSTRVRRAIRKAQANNVKVVFSKSEKYVQSFFAIYNDLMREKNARDEYLFNEDYFIHLLQSDNTYLVCAENEDREVIGAVIFFASGHISEYHLSASNAEGKLKKVTNLLIYEFGEFIKVKKVRSLYLGGGTDGTNENSLLYFKRGFSKKEIPFNIGKFTHDPVTYDNLKASFVERNPKKDQLIIFYR